MHTATQETYEAEVVAASREQPVLVDFWGPRCVPCMQMMPWVEELAEQHAGTLKIVKVHSQENWRLCVALNVRGLPTFILYQDGAEVQRLSGDGCNPRTISEALQQAIPNFTKV